MTDGAIPARNRSSRSGIILEQELRDLWLGGRGLVLLLAFSVLLGILAYLVATNRALNFLEQREAVNLVLQVSVAVGTLLTLLTAADAISGERERGTFESLLLTPVSKLDVAAAKLGAALSLWAAAFAVTIPYVWFLGRGVGIVGEAFGAGLLVGTLLALFLAGLGILVSTFASSNRASLSVSLFLLIALFAPTQLPSSAQRGWAGELLLRVNPITAGEHAIGKLVVDGRPWSQQGSWLLAPAIGAVCFSALALLAASRYAGLRGRAAA